MGTERDRVVRRIRSRKGREIWMVQMVGETKSKIHRHVKKDMSIPQVGCIPSRQLLRVTWQAPLNVKALSCNISGV